LNNYVLWEISQPANKHKQIYLATTNHTYFNQLLEDKTFIEEIFGLVNGKRFHILFGSTDQFFELHIEQELYFLEHNIG